MTQQAGQPESPLFGPTMPFAQQPPPPMGPQPEAMAAPGLPSGPPPEAPPNPLGFQPQPGPDWKAQLPMLLTALAGLAGAGHNQFGAAAYLRGFQETQDQQAAMAQHQAEQAAIADRLRREDAFKQQQFDLARHDRLTALDETRRKDRATFISGLLQKASEYDDPEQQAAFLKSQEAIGKEFGVNTAALPVIQSPAAIQRTQKGINDAFTAMQKQYKEEMFAPGWGEGVSIDVNGHQMSGADVLRRQTVLARNKGAIDPPPPDTGTGQEGINLATAYRAFKDDPKRGNGRWPNAAEQNKIQLDQDRAIALARKVSGDPNAGGVTPDARMTAMLAKMVPGTPSFKLAQDLAYGRMTFSQFRTIFAYSRDAQAKQALYFKASQLNDQFNPAQFEMGFKFASNPKVQTALAAVDNVLPNLQRAVDLSDQITRYDEPAVNDILAKVRFQMGNQKVSNFRQLQKILGDEIGIALGAGGMTDMKLQLGLDIVDPNLSPETFFSNMQQVQDYLISRKRSWLNQMGIYGTPEMNPGGGTDYPALTSTTAPANTAIVTSGPFEAGQVRKRKDGSVVKLLRKNPQTGAWDVQPVGP